MAEKTARAIDSWHGTGPCAIWKLDPPMAGHKYIATICWYFMGRFRRGFFPCDGTRDGIDEYTFIGDSGKTVEDEGYTIV